jgi:hypothetical protein
MSGQGPPKLDYALKPLPWHQRRRTRRALLGILAAGMTIGVWTGRTTAWQAYKVQWMWHDFLARQQRCLDYAPPPNQIVVDNDPADFDKLLTSDSCYKLLGGSQWWPRQVLYSPSVWHGFGTPGIIDGWLQTDATVKLQVRDGPATKPRVSSISRAAEQNLLARNDDR